MLEWLKNFNKDYPEFWKIYLTKFENKPTRFVVLSTDTSGLDPQKDVLFSIGAVAIVDNCIVVSDALEIVLLEKDNISDSESENEFLIYDPSVKIDESVAIQSVIEYLGNAILVGHRINFDVDMLNGSLDKMKCGRLKNEAIDIEVMYKKLHDINDDKQFSLNDLLRAYKLIKSDRHSSSEDAYSIALLFLKLKSKLGIN